MVFTPDCSQLFYVGPRSVGSRHPEAVTWFTVSYCVLTDMFTFTMRLKKRRTFEWLVLPMNIKKIAYQNLKSFKGPSQVLSFGAHLVLLFSFV